MKTTFKSLALAVASVLALSFSLTSCQERFEIKEVEEGLPVSISFNLSLPMPEEVVITKATNEQETQINKLALLFFKSESSRPIVIEEPLYNLKSKVSGTDYIYTVTCEDDEVTSGDWYLYAIANYNSSDYGSASLDKIKSMSKAQLDAYTIKQGEVHLDMLDNGLLLTGKYGDGGAAGNSGLITLEPGENDLTGDDVARIHLRRIVSKISVKVAAGEGVTFVPEKIVIRNYSQSSTLFERDGWQNAAGAVNYTYGTFPGDLGYLGAADSFVDQTAYFDKNGAITFYMMENAQTAKEAFPADDYRYRESRTADLKSADPEAGFYYAPDNATYVVITGTYNGPGVKVVDGEYVVDTENTATGDVTYTVHLGNFSTTGANTIGKQDNFTIRRNTKYDYTIKVVGVKNIVVEAETNDEGNPGAEGNIVSNTEGTTNLIVDSHYETIQLAIPAAKYDEYVLRVTTPYDDETYHSNVEGSVFPTDVDWITFMPSKSATEVAEYKPAKAYSVSTLMDTFFKNFDASKSSTYSDYCYYDATNKIAYVTAFVNEYFYEGKPLKEFVNTELREMTIVAGMSVSADKRSTYAATNLFSIKQRPIVSVYNLDVANPFGMEVIEEYKDPVTLNSSKSDSSTSTSASYGWKNFASNFVTVSTSGTVSNDDSKQWSSYYDMTKLAHFDNSAYFEASEENGEYGLYQCLSRNRDLDGDGKISGDEIKWYLPSHDECLTIWDGYPSLSYLAKANSSKLYFSSTNSTSRTWWVDEGSAFGAYKTDTQWNNGGMNSVRCIRALKDYNKQTSAVSSFDSANREISLSGLGEGSIRANGKTGEYSKNHYRDEAPDQLPTSFIVASSNLSFSAGDIYEIQAPRVRLAGYNDANKIFIQISNYTTLSAVGTLYYTKGTETAQTAISSETVTGINPSSLTWTAVDDVTSTATINLYSERTISGTSYTSNPTVVTFTRVQNESSDEYSYSTAVSLGSAVDETQHAYPYVSNSVNLELDQNRVSFTVNNYSNLSTPTYTLSQKDGAPTDVSSYYPVVDKFETDGSAVRIWLKNTGARDNQNFYYVKNQSGKSSQNYTAGGVSFGQYNSYASVSLNNSDWNNNKVVITLYSTMYSSGYRGYDYRGTNYQTVIEVTRSTSTPYYTVNDGAAVKITSAYTTVNFTESSFVDNAISIRVYAQEYNTSDAYASYVYVFRSNGEYSYSYDYAKGATKTEELNKTTHSSFTQDEVASSSYCELYYSEETDKSDLGKWRIPNERELGVMFLYYPNGLTKYTASRSLYNRGSNVSRPYYVEGSTGSYFITTDSGHSDPFYIRCVRDAE